MPFAIAADPRTFSV